MDKWHAGGVESARFLIWGKNQKLVRHKAVTLLLDCGNFPAHVCVIKSVFRIPHEHVFSNSADVKHLWCAAIKRDLNPCEPRAKYIIVWWGQITGDSDEQTMSGFLFGHLTDRIRFKCGLGACSGENNVSWIILFWQVWAKKWFQMTENRSYGGMLIWWLVVITSTRESADNPFNFTPWIRCHRNLPVWPRQRLLPETDSSAEPQSGLQVSSEAFPVAFSSKCCWKINMMLHRDTVWYEGKAFIRAWVLIWPISSWIPDVQVWMNKSNKSNHDEKGSHAHMGRGGGSIKKDKITPEQNSKKQKIIRQTFCLSHFQRANQYCW